MTQSAPAIAAILKLKSRSLLLAGIAAVAPTLCLSLPALADDGGQASTLQPIPDPDVAARQGANDQFDSAFDATDDTTVAVPSAPDTAASGDVMAPMPGVAVPPRNDAPAMVGPVYDPGRPTIAPDALYGPPSPKQRKGNLPAIGWTEPARVVPPALEEAVQIVTRNYPSALAARSALRAANSDVSSAKWQRFPSLTGNLAYLDDRGSPQPEVVVEAPIWAGGRISANIRRARAQEDVSSAQYVETVQQLALTVSQVYFEIARLTLREQLLKESLAEHLRLVETMERRVAQEVSPQADLELARSRAAQIQQEYTVSQAARETNLRVLAQLVADPSYDLGPIPFFDPALDLASKTTLEEQAVAYDPQISRRRSEADISRADLDLRRAAILPQVNAQYSYSDVFGSRVGVVLRSQTGSGLSALADVNSAQARIQTAIENVRVAEQELRREVAADIINFEAAKARAVISTDAAATSARVSESYTRQFIAGRRSWLDVMNALREAVNNAIGKTDAEMTALATATKLLLESGRWRPVFSDQTNAGMRIPESQETGQ
ncbi:TolC family protein [Novosphingobium aquimarinum]|uniref:TolC family protein n=1 Tax=Novosphingobium aquimarinum TaxID=2682494 RepID=UPI0012EBE595|nr:TolC family protein [Novosphingobium aquimarinum]